MTKNISYWSRAPGRFVDKLSGEEYKPLTTKGRNLVMVSETNLQTEPRMVVRVFQEKDMDIPSAPVFTGTVRDWYETLTESIMDACNMLHRKHLQAPGILEVSPEVLTILEHTMSYRANYVPDGLPLKPPLMTYGEFVGTFNNVLKVVKVNGMAQNEAKVVLITKTKCSYIMDHDLKVNKIFDTEVFVEILPSLQRLDEWTIHVLDMCAL